MLSVIDARRGEIFASAYQCEGHGEISELVQPRALAPDRLESVIASAEQRGSGAGGWLAVGDGAVRHRGALEALPLTIPPESSSLHLIDAGTVCELGLSARPLGGHEQLLPDYRRRPDAELALEALAGPGQVAR
jgi:tRNA A37 threonylcarbamoyladenosine modification protein TsaB